MHGRTVRQRLDWPSDCCRRLPPPPSRSGRSFETGIAVELSEILQVGDDFADGEYEETLSAYALAEVFGGMDPIDADCPAAGKCIGLLTRVSPGLGLSCSSLFPHPAPTRITSRLASVRKAGVHIYPVHRLRGWQCALSPWATTDTRRRLFRTSYIIPLMTMQ